MTPLFFYSYWPLAYHNLEAERKAVAFSRAGYDVTYVAGVGIRNPRPQSARKLLDRASSKLRPAPRSAAAPEPGELRTASVLVVPPRQVGMVRRANTAWMERQLRAILERWDESVAWIRWPTPELVDALARIRPAAVVYECVDAYHVSPGITGGWIDRFERAERALVGLADLCVTPSEPLADRLRDLGARVEVVPHGVDLDPWDGPRERAPGPTTVGFVGTLDYKLESTMLSGIARALPDWRMRLIGPIQEGFDPRELAGLPNVSVEPPIPATEVAQAIASFDVGVMPYFDHPAYTASCPLKNLEYMGMGKAAVARWAPALEPYRDLLYFASTPAEFARELRRAVAEDTPERQRARRAVAEANTWDRRLGELTELVRGLTPGHPSAESAAASIPRALGR
jgi:glycosyltransferase involved in cell wall biosynthesis